LGLNTQIEGKSRFIGYCGARQQQAAPQTMLGVGRTAWGLNPRVVNRAVNVLKTRELIFCRDV
jgi:hypothetical protein